MFALNRTTRVLLKIEATNLRLGFDGLYGEVVSILTQDPPSGHVFGFCDRARTKVKLPTFDGSGLWGCAKRLEGGRFAWPQSGESEIDILALQAVLSGFELKARRCRYRRPLPAAAAQAPPIRVSGRQIPPTLAQLRRMAEGNLRASAARLRLQRYRGDNYGDTEGLWGSSLWAMSLNCSCSRSSTGTLSRCRNSARAAVSLATSTSSIPDARIPHLTGACPMPCTSMPCRSRRLPKPQSSTYPAAKSCPDLRVHLCLPRVSA